MFDWAGHVDKDSVGNDSEDSVGDDSEGTVGDDIEGTVGDDIEGTVSQGDSGDFLVGSISVMCHLSQGWKVLNCFDSCLGYKD